MSNSASSAGNELVKLLQPTKPGASLWTTFQFLTNLVFFVCWVIALPTELILHRRVGRRYMTTLVAVLSFVVAFLGLGFGSQFMKQVNGTRAAASAPADLGLKRETPRQTAALRTNGDRLTAFSTVHAGYLLAAIAAYFGHRLWNWRRFRTAEQLHSMFAGVPAIVFPPLPRRNLQQSQSVVRSSDGELERVAEPSSGDQSTLRREIADFWARIRHGEQPTGLIVWTVTAWLEPALVVVGGVVFAVTSHDFLGVYLAFAGAAMFVKGRIYAAMVIDKIYDLFDARIEQGLLTALVEPKKVRELEEKGYVIPGAVQWANAARARIVEAPGHFAEELRQLLAPDSQGRLTGGLNTATASRA